MNLTAKQRRNVLRDLARFRIQCMSLYQKNTMLENFIIASLSADRDSALIETWEELTEMNYKEYIAETLTPEA